MTVARPEAEGGEASRGGLRPVREVAAEHRRAKFVRGQFDFRWQILPAPEQGCQNDSADFAGNNEADSATLATLRRQVHWKPRDRAARDNNWPMNVRSTGLQALRDMTRR